MLRKAETMKRMIFEGANFRYIPGRNTFRIGDKWAKQLSLNEEIEATDLEGNVLGTLKVKGIYLSNLDDAFQKFTKENHGVIEHFLETFDRASKDYLLDVLKQVYPNEIINPQTPMTVVEFYANV